MNEAQNEMQVKCPMCPRVFLSLANKRAQESPAIVADED